MSKPPLQSTSHYQKSSRYCAIALVCFSVALLNFGVGVFINRPEGTLGIFFLCLGILFMLGSITFFALFNHYSKEGEDNAS